MCITVGGAKRNLRIGCPPPPQNPAGMRLSINTIIISPLQGFIFWMGGIRRLRFASPPVMHISSLAGLKPSQADFLTEW
ncbi:MAG: hypothetical protein LBU34_09570 [Planctomycetaceae bacterium]|nr:hypothetical protein [Planctomycetaceae bacterium]